MDDNLRPLAIVNDNAGLLEALRARGEELDVSRVALDERTGLASGYCAKLLCGMKGLGSKSMGPVLQSMGLVLIVAEDVEATERLRRELPKRSPGKATRNRAAADAAESRHHPGGDNHA